jgi:chromosome segregation ATPase
VAGLKTQNADLHRRLEISTQVNTDVNTRLQKYAASPVGQTDMIRLESQLNDLQQSNRAELDHVKQTMRESNENYARLQSNQALPKSQLSRIVRAAQVYFHSEFANEVSLLDFLMRSPLLSGSSAVIDPELESQLRKARSRLAKETKQRKQLELEVLELRKTAETDSLNHSVKLPEFQESLRGHTNERKRMERAPEGICELQTQLRQQRKMKSLSTQTMILKIGFAASERQSLQDELHDRNGKIARLEDIIRDLTNQIADRGFEVESVTKDATKTNSQAVQLATELRAAQNPASGLEGELETVKKYNEERVASEESLKAQIADLEAAHAAAMERAQRNLELVHDKLRSWRAQFRIVIGCG